MRIQSISYRKLLVLTLVVVIAIFFFTYLLSMQWGSIRAAVNESVERFGLLGFFVASIIANATIFLPVPIDVAVFLFGKIEFYALGLLSPLLLGLVVGLGAAIGELSGYIIGLFGVKSIEKMKREEIKKIVEKEKEIHKYGVFVILIGAFTPFPFDLIGIAAGLIKFDPKKFFLACLIGKILRYVLIAYAGFYSIEFLRGLLGF